MSIVIILIMLWTYYLVSQIQILLDTLLNIIISIIGKHKCYHSMILLHCYIMYNILLILNWSELKVIICHFFFNIFMDFFNRKSRIYEVLRRKMLAKTKMDITDTHIPRTTTTTITTTIPTTRSRPCRNDVTKRGWACQGGGGMSSVRGDQSQSKDQPSWTFITCSFINGKAKVLYCSMMKL